MIRLVRVADFCRKHREWVMTRQPPQSRTCQVKRVYIEDRVGRRNMDVAVTAPTLEQVLDAVRRLNGDNTTMVILEMDGKQFGIAGGTSGRYMGELTYGIDDAFYTLLSSAEPAKPGDEEVELVT